MPSLDPKLSPDVETVAGQQLSAHRLSDDLCTSLLVPHDSTTQEIRGRIGQEGLSAVFHERVRRRDTLGALIAVEASSTPMPVTAQLLEHDIAPLREPRIIEALIRSGTPVMADPALYLAIIRAEIRSGEEPQLVKALVQNGLGPHRMKGALSLACAALESQSQREVRTTIRIVELLLSAGAPVDEGEGSPLRLAVGFRQAELTKLLCEADGWGTAIRRLCFELGAAGAQSEKSLRFLLECLDSHQRQEGLEHALDGALQGCFDARNNTIKYFEWFARNMDTDASSSSETSASDTTRITAAGPKVQPNMREAMAFMGELLRVGARGYRLAVTSTFDRLGVSPFWDRELGIRHRYFTKLHQPESWWDAKSRARYLETKILGEVVNASDVQTIRAVLRQYPLFRDETDYPLRCARDRKIRMIGEVINAPSGITFTEALQRYRDFFAKKGVSLEHVVDCEDVRLAKYQALKGLFEYVPSLRDEAASALEVAVDSGDLELVKYFVEELKVPINENEGTPLILISQEGYVDIFEYLLSKGADITAQNHAPLIDAARFANAEIVRILLQKGADLGVDNGYPLYLCAINTDEAKRSPALECAKHLVEHGAHPKLFGLPLDIHKGAAAEYLFLMSEVMNPNSPLHIQAIDSRFTKQHINFKDPSYRHSHVYKYISNCAVVAASIGDISIAREFFVSFLREGAYKVFTEKRGRFKDLADATTRDLDGYQDLQDIGVEFALDILLPTVAAQSPEDIKEATDTVEQKELFHIIRKHLYPEAARILFNDRPLLDILKLNKVWHRDDKRMPMMAHPLRSDASWHPLIPDVFLSNGFSLHALTDNKALAREGSALHHCLGKGGYASACLAGVTHLVSLRHQSEPVATLQFREEKRTRTEIPREDGTFLRLQQFRGAYNHLPSNEANSAFNEFKERVRNKNIILKAGPVGETPESIILRQRSGISTLESLTGMPLGQRPTLAIEHYREALTITPNKTDPAIEKHRISLLRNPDVQVSARTARALMDELLSRRKSPKPE